MVVHFAWGQLGERVRPNSVSRTFFSFSIRAVRRPRNHLSARTAGFFCYGDDGANEEDGSGKPKRLEHPEWFDASHHPQRGKDERQAYQGLVWQCRYSDIEVPDRLWSCTTFGAGKPYADDQADDMLKEKKAMAAFQRWVDDFTAHVQKKGPIPDVKQAEAAAQTTTNRGKAKIT